MGGRETIKQQISLARQKSDNQYKSEDDDTRERHTDTQTHQVEDTQVSARLGLPHILRERTALYATRCHVPSVHLGQSRSVTTGHWKKRKDSVSCEVRIS